MFVLDHGCLGHETDSAMGPHRDDARAREIDEHEMQCAPSLCAERQRTNFRDATTTTANPGVLEIRRQHAAVDAPATINPTRYAVSPDAFGPAKPSGKTGFQGAMQCNSRTIANTNKRLQLRRIVAFGHRYMASPVANKQQRSGEFFNKEQACVRIISSARATAAR